MRPEPEAWRDLQQHASARLRGGFADRVLRQARGPAPETWRHLAAEGAASLRPGFAERVLRAARAAADLPSFGTQFIWSAATAAACVVAVVFLHERNLRLADDRNLAEWRQLAAGADDLDSGEL
jgi:hypothetical protein